MSRSLIVIIFGLISISCASVLIKLCSAPSFVIASYRLTIAALFYLMIVKAQKRSVWKSLTGSQRKLTFISGLFLTLHFATWITSLKYTSVASSVTLVQIAPMFVALGSAVFLKEKPTIFMLAGILISIIGSWIIGWQDFVNDRQSFVGNILAIGGAIGASGYMIAGRKARCSMDIFHYVSIVYSVAAVLLIALTVCSGDSLIGYSGRDYALMIAIAIIPQIIGHTSFNWALKYFSATTVSVIILGEPIGASALALFFLGEKMTLMKLISIFIIIIGVGIVLINEGRQQMHGEMK